MSAITALALLKLKLVKKLTLILLSDGAPHGFEPRTY